MKPFGNQNTIIRNAIRCKIHAREAAAVKCAPFVGRGYRLEMDDYGL